MRHCVQLARGHIGEPISDDLDVALTRLRAEWWDHDKLESLLIKEVLTTPLRTPQQIERMVQDHLNEHADVWAELCRPARHVIARLEDLCVMLEAHMVGEERTFLSIPPTPRRELRGTSPPRA